MTLTAIVPLPIIIPASGAGTSSPMPAGVGWFFAGFFALFVIAIGGFLVHILGDRKDPYGFGPKSWFGWLLYSLAWVVVASLVAGVIGLAIYSAGAS